MRATGVVTPKMALVGKKHPALHRVADRVEPEEYAEMRRLLPRVYASLPDNGYALALPQVGISKQAIVTQDGTMWLNPLITPVGEETNTKGEGCLSLPGRWYAIERFNKVRVQALRLGFDEPEDFETINELDARIWQHEADHLAGRLISEMGPEVYEHA